MKEKHAPCIVAMIHLQALSLINYDTLSKSVVASKANMVTLATNQCSTTLLKICDFYTNNLKKHIYKMKYKSCKNKKRWNIIDWQYEKNNDNVSILPKKCY